MKESDNNDFKQDVIFGMQLVKDYILEEGKNSIFQINIFSKMMACDIKEKIDNLSKSLDKENV